MKDIIAQQRKYFASNATKSIDFRLTQLQLLKSALREHEPMLHEAIASDVKKSRFENLLTELYLVYEELDAALANLEEWARAKPVRTDIFNEPGRCYMVPEPLGVSLVIGPWNYPFQLTLAPLVAALAAGCTAVVKPSELMPHCSRALARLVAATFEPRYLAVVEGGIPETTELLEQRFDKIFFTGSVPVGKIVYQAAAKQLTPVTLELGGKSPAIVMADADLATTARRLVWGKFLNAGQTCIAPDYVCVERTVEQELLRHIVREVRKVEYSPENGNYVQIVNDRNVARLLALIEPSKVLLGGGHDRARRFIEPTVMHGVTWDDRVMREEIFGPLLPVLAFDRLGDVVAEIKSRPKPLALYLFTADEATKRRVLGEISFGGGSVNDAILHIANGDLPFGGVGDSGIGRYHGEHGFLEFSHQKSIVEKDFHPDGDVRYPPYTPEKNQIMQSLIDAHHRS